MMQFSWSTLWLLSGAGFAYALVWWTGKQDWHDNIDPEHSPWMREWATQPRKGWNLAGIAMLLATMVLIAWYS